MNPQPPKYFKQLFQWLCHPDLFEELQGDLQEGFHDNVRSKGQRRASWMYRWEVVKMIRPSVVRNIVINSKLNFLIMFKNYFKTSIRALMKNPISALINLVGLSAAIGVCIFAYAFVQWTYSTDQFHENKDNVFLVTSFADREGRPQQFGKTPRPLTQQLKEDFPIIKNTCRIDSRNVVVKNGENVFHERILMVDPSFLKMFTFPLESQGPKEPLNDVGNVVISQEMAEKYFGDENPIGKSLMIKYGNEKNRMYFVSGVAEEFPDARSFSFHFLVNIKNLQSLDPGYDYDDWGQMVDANLIQVNQPDDIAKITTEISSYLDIYNGTQSQWKIESFGFEPLSTIHYRSEHIRDDIFYSVHENYNSIVFLVVLSIFLILLACFNYINIAIVSAAKRLKEISLRKVIGASKSMIMTQFLTENIFLTSIAAIAGLVLGTVVFIPWFEGMFSFNMSFDFATPVLYIFLISIVLVTGLVSGLYPAIYVAKFHAISIMKGSLKFGRKNVLTKVLLGFQLILSCILISVGVMFTINHDYMAERSWGYDQSAVLYTSVPDHSTYVQLRHRMSENPNVISMTGSIHHLGKEQESIVIERPNREFEVHALAVGDNYQNTMGLTMKTGRWFEQDHAAERQKVIVNETFVKDLKLQDPIGDVFKFEEMRFEIIGVVNDFHHRSFFSTIRPTVFTLAEDTSYQYLSMKVRSGKETETYLALKDEWSNLFPDEPFQGGYQEDVWGYYFTEVINHGRFWRGIAMVAVLLAALGLYGLVTLNVAGRVREFSIRKTLGAHTGNIFGTMMRPYLWLYVAGLGVGLPVSFIASNELIDFAYQYHIPESYTGAVTGVVILISILFIVGVVEVSRLSRSNPVEGLRTE